MTHEQPSPSCRRFPLLNQISSDLSIEQIDERTIGAEEENLWLVIQVNYGLLDTRSLAWNEEVDDCIDVFLEAQSWYSTKPANITRSVCFSAVAKRKTYDGKIVPLAPPSGISLFLRD